MNSYPTGSTAPSAGSGTPQQQQPSNTPEPVQPLPGPAQPGQGQAPPYSQSYNGQNRPVPSGQMWRSSTQSFGQRERTTLAIILIGAGALFLLPQLMPGVSFFGNVGDLILLLLGAVFLYAYFTTRPGYRIGFLIPGAILLGIGVGETLSHLPFVSVWAPQNLVALTLGLGFCLIWFLERYHWWALIPGGILVITSLSEGWAIGRLWPLLLVLLGGYLLYDQYRRRQRL